MTNPLSRRGALALTVLAALTAAPALAVAEEVIAVTADQHLITFDSTAPGVLTSDRAITGIVADLVVAIDLRPADGRLYAVTSRSQLYRIDLATAAATPVGTGPFAAALGTLTGMDVDPVRDVIRLVNDQDRNLRLDPDSGLVLDGTPATFGIDEDLPLVYAPGDANFGIDPTVVVIAHDENRKGAAATTLFGIDTRLDVLVAIDPADDGALHTVGPLGLATGYVAGFDVSGSTGVAYTILTLRSEGVPGLYTVDLGTGAAAAAGIVGAPSPVVAMTLGPPGTATVPTTALIGLTAGGELVRFSSDSPVTITKRVTVTGLVAGDTLVAIAVRPSNGRLYGLGSSGRIYVIDARSGVARAVRLTPFEVPLSGSAFAFDFQPKTSRIRIVSASGQSLRVDPDTGSVVDGDRSLPGVQPDTPLAFDSFDVHAGEIPIVAGLAFDRADTIGATTAFAIDPVLSVLIRLGSVDGSPESPSRGVVHTVGDLGVRSASFEGFEIAGDSTGFAAFGTPDGTQLFSVDLTTGFASLIGDVGVTDELLDLSVAPTSNPTFPATDLVVRRTNIRLDFTASGRDSATIEGTLPLPPGGFAGQVVTVDLGGFSKTFVLGPAGKAKDDAATPAINDDDVFAFAARPNDGRIRFTVKFRREDLQSALADEGLVGTASVTRQPRTVEVTITIGTQTYSLPVALRFTARAGRTGVATKAND